MSKVTDLNEHRSKAQRVDLPEHDMLMFCPCGSPMFMVFLDGLARCAFCGQVATEADCHFTPFDSTDFTP